MHVVRHAASRKKDAIRVANDPANVGAKAGCQVRPNDRQPVFRAEDEMDAKARE
jgi:hypothetical protein